MVIGKQIKGGIKIKIKFDYTFEVDRKKFPNLTAEEIRDHFLSCALGYIQHVEEETLNLLADENAAEDFRKKRGVTNG